MYIINVAYPFNHRATIQVPPNVKILKLIFDSKSIPFFFKLHLILSQEELKKHDGTCNERIVRKSSQQIKYLRFFRHNPSRNFGYPSDSDKILAEENWCLPETKQEKLLGEIKRFMLLRSFEKWAQFVGNVRVAQVQRSEAWGSDS